jgi:hypothetical protein
MAYPIRVRLLSGAEVRFAMLSEDSLDTFLKLLSFWSPTQDFTKMEFYLSSNRIVEGIPFPQQGISGNSLLLTVPKAAVGNEFPTMLVLTTRSRFWSIYPQHELPIYLRVECIQQPPRYLLIESDADEKISRLKNTINQFGGGYVQKQRLLLDEKILHDDKTVNECGLVSGTTIQCKLDP